MAFVAHPPPAPVSFEEGILEIHVNTTVLLQGKVRELTAANHRLTAEVAALREQVADLQKKACVAAATVLANKVGAVTSSENSPAANVVHPTSPPHFADSPAYDPEGGVAQSPDNVGMNAAANSGGHDEAENGDHDEADNGGHNEADNGCHDEADDGGHDEADDGGHDEADDGGHDEADNGCHDEADDGGHDEADNGCHDEADNGCHDEADNGCHDEADNGCHDEADNGCHDEADDGGHDEADKADDFDYGHGQGDDGDDGEAGGGAHGAVHESELRVMPCEEGKNMNDISADGDVGGLGEKSYTTHSTTFSPEVSESSRETEIVADCDFGLLSHIGDKEVVDEVVNSGGNAETAASEALVPPAQDAEDCAFSAALAGDVAKDVAREAALLATIRAARATEAARDAARIAREHAQAAVEAAEAVVADEGDQLTAVDASSDSTSSDSTLVYDLTGSDEDDDGDLFCGKARICDGNVVVKSEPVPSEPVPSASAPVPSASAPVPSASAPVPSASAPVPSEPASDTVPFILKVARKLPGILRKRIRNDASGAGPAFVTGPSASAAWSGPVLAADSAGSMQRNKKHRQAADRADVDYDYGCDDDSDEVDLAAEVLCGVRKRISGGGSGDCVEAVGKASAVLGPVLDWDMEWATVTEADLPVLVDLRTPSTTPILYQMYTLAKDASVDEFRKFLAAPKALQLQGSAVWRREVVRLYVSLLDGAITDVTDRELRQFFKLFVPKQATKKAGQYRLPVEFLRPCDVATAAFAAPSHHCHDMFLRFLAVYETDGKKWTCDRTHCVGRCIHSRWAKDTGTQASSGVHYTDLPLCWILHYMSVPLLEWNKSTTAGFVSSLRILRHVMDSALVEHRLLTGKWLVAHTDVAVEALLDNKVFHKALACAKLRVMPASAAEAEKPGKAGKAAEAASVHPASRNLMTFAQL